MTSAASCTEPAGSRTTKLHEILGFFGSSMQAFVGVWNERSNTKLCLTRLPLYSAYWNGLLLQGEIGKSTPAYPGGSHATSDGTAKWLHNR